jgi:hypothetical protein
MPFVRGVRLGYLRLILQKQTANKSRSFSFSYLLLSTMATTEPSQTSVRKCKVTLRDPSQYHRMPWKNEPGETDEICTDPPGVNFRSEPLLWRSALPSSQPVALGRSFHNAQIISFCCHIFVRWRLHLLRSPWIRIPLWANKSMALQKHLHSRSWAAVVRLDIHLLLLPSLLDWVSHSIQYTLSSSLMKSAYAFDTFASMLRQPFSTCTMVCYYSIGWKASRFFGRHAA